MLEEHPSDDGCACHSSALILVKRFPWKEWPSFEWINILFYLLECSDHDLLR
jgi:hypothetical protein